MHAKLRCIRDHQVRSRPKRVDRVAYVHSSIQGGRGRIASFTERLKSRRVLDVSSNLM